MVKKNNNNLRIIILIIIIIAILLILSFLFYPTISNKKGKVSEEKELSTLPPRETTSFKPVECPERPSECVVELVPCPSCPDGLVVDGSDPCEGYNFIDDDGIECNYSCSYDYFEEGSCITTSSGKRCFGICKGDILI